MTELIEPSGRWRTGERVEIVPSSTSTGSMCRPTWRGDPTTWNGLSGLAAVELGAARQEPCRE